MAGGLLNLVSQGQENIILFGNPQKTFFKATYKRFTNFGMQKFRLDNEGSRTLNNDTETKLRFKVSRYADLLYDNYLVMDIPDIWSPLYIDGSGTYIEYGFRWIDELGSNLIKEVEIEVGGTILSRYTGEYFANIVKRDRENAKIDLWNRMTGNIAELNDPANALGRVNIYPNAYNPSPPGSNTTNVRPSIRGRKLYIPLDFWFGRMSKVAFPLISLQYHELYFNVTLRPIKELYMVRDVEDVTNFYPYLAPNQNNSLFQTWRFLSPPEDVSGTISIKRNNWNADIHIMSTYIFLDNQERETFARYPQNYLIKDVYTWEFNNTVGTQVIDLDSRGLISSYMFRFRRNDAYMRNTWSNYTNWPYNSLPYQVTNVGSPNPLLFITGTYTPGNFYQNDPGILLDMAFVLDGKYRENTLDEGVFNYIEKYNNTPGGSKDGLYVYSFSLNTDNWSYQPNGAMNMDKFENIQFVYNTIEPGPAELSNNFVSICDPEGNIIGTRKNLWDLNEYAFDLTVFEERYNIVHFENGMAGLKYAR